MWTAKETTLSKNKHFAKPYNYFKEIHYLGYIGKTATMKELIDYIRNSEDSYNRLHIEETNEYGAKYILTVRSICYGYTVEFLLFNLDDLTDCDELEKEELEEVRQAIAGRSIYG